MRRAKFFAILFLSIMAGSCAQMSSGPARSQAQSKSVDSRASEWLQSMRGTPALNITGVWDAGPSMGGGWGEARFVQTGGDVIGTMGLYNVQGVVNERNVYLVLSSNGRMYFTAHLELAGKGDLTGKAAESAIVDEPGSATATVYPMILKRMSD